MNVSFNKTFFWSKGIFPSFIFFTVGCTPQLFWAKPGAQPDEFEEDAKQCREQLLSSSGQQEESQSSFLSFKISDEAIEQCLMDKGWVLAEKP